MLSFESTDIPYSPQVTDGEQKFSNLEELKSNQSNQDAVLNQNPEPHVTEIGTANGINSTSPQRNDFPYSPNFGENVAKMHVDPKLPYYVDRFSEHSGQAISPYQHHHLPSNPLLLNQSYQTPNQNLYVHPRGYDQRPDQNYFHHPQMFQQQQMQNQIYCHVNSSTNFSPYNNYNNFNDAVHCPVLGGSEETCSTPNRTEQIEIQNQRAQQIMDTFSNCRYSNPRKRPHDSTDASDYEPETGDEVKMIRSSAQSKRNHSQIEKKRRDKMNTYIAELSTLIPMCHSMSRKLDKLTVLRLAIQHLKTIRGSVYSFTESEYKPTFLSDKEHKMLILQRADGFLFVVGCDRGRLLYVSESVSQVLNYSQGELLGQSWFDILHPEDVGKIKEQLSSSDLPREKLIDARTMLPVKADYQQGLSLMCPGARRSFFCRMKCKTTITSKDTANNFNNDLRRKKQMNSDKKYIVVHCTGYLRSWASTKFTSDEQSETETEDYSGNLSCLVAVGRILPTITQLSSSKYPYLEKLEFTSRHAIDGKFLFVDQSATIVLGFLPQELLGTSMYEYFEHEDISALAEAHKTALRLNEEVKTSVYRFRTKENGFVCLQSTWRTLKNPWTNEMEYLAAKNIVIFDGDEVLKRTDFCDSGPNTDGANKTNNTMRGSQRAINTQIDAMKIGRQIAEQALESHRRTLDSSSDGSPDPGDRLLGTLNTIPPPISLFADIPNDIDPVNSFPPIRQRINGMSQPRINGVNGSNNSSERDLTRLTDSSTEPNSPAQGEASTNNDEAAMAVIMSLLEADAGLGGPVDYTGLPWPLP